MTEPSLPRDVQADVTMIDRLLRGLAALSGCSRRRHLGALALGAALSLLGAGCASSQPAEAEEIYKDGQSKAQTDSQGAIKAYEAGLVNYPNHTRMRFALAQLQYEQGEVQHLEQLRLKAAARRFEDEGKTSDSQKTLRDAEDRKTKALPFYRAARDNFQIVAEHDSADLRRAWAYQLLVKCDVFFEDYEAAADHMDKAIDLGKPTGQKLAQYKEFQGSLKAQSKRRSKDM